MVGQGVVWCARTSHHNHGQRIIHTKSLCRHTQSCDHLSSTQEVFLRPDWHNILPTNFEPQLHIENHWAAANANQHSLLPVHQSSYQQHYSTKTAVISVRNDIIRATDTGLASALALLDLSSSFDTSDHEIQIDKLRDWFVIEDHELEWFCSYHTGRSQTFKTPDNSCRPVSMTFSVPQGLRIEPQEFTEYTEDMADMIDSFSIG